MKIPRFLNIFGSKVRLLVSLKMSQNMAGMYDPDKEIIYLNANHDTDRELLHTLLHEAGHALFYRVSIQQAVSWEIHEFIVNNYSTMLLENFEIKPKVKK